MPITLVTGLPGNGKTLYSLANTKERAEKEGRQVYYSGIKDLKLPWVEIEAEKWFEVPPGSIVVIDECQRVFRPRMHGKDVPKHVEELETHRHKGVDLVLITQHPMLADAAIRRLTDRHLHVVRAFGTESATIHEWGQVRENCEKPAGRSDSIKHVWKYPKDVYSWYHSAEVHTVKRRIPAKLIMLGVLPFVLAGLVWRVYHTVEERMHPDQVQAAAPGRKAITGPITAAPAEKWRDPAADARQYVFNATPRVAGLIYTAPKYDELTKPTKVPVPAACIFMKGRCECYTQQATPLNVSYNQCVDIAHHGFFEDFDRQQQARTDQSVKVLNNDAPLPLSGASRKDSPPAIVAAADGYGVLGKRGPGVRQRPQDSEPMHY